MAYLHCPENWARLSALIESLPDLPEDQQLSWIDNCATESEGIKAQLRELLAIATPADKFLYKQPNFADAILGEATHFQKIRIELQPDRLIGAYRLIREIGQGGMGSVWLAQRVDGKFKRDVALKFPYAGPHQRQLVERLIRERDILAGLQHANIARLYDADVTESGQPFLVLEYIDGIAINVYCDQQRLDIRARLLLFQQVLSAVRYAHAHLAIHRDLKPSNILITDDGVVHLLDFGIATSIAGGATHETPLTLFGGSVLTPEYASPEQVKRTTLTTASDVYSLGVLLFELLTGTLPYRWRRDQRAQLEEAVANADVIIPSRVVINDVAAACRNIRPEQLRKVLRGEVDSLLLKALKQQPDERYASADAFAEDIARYLENKPILAQLDTQWYRIRKFTQRNRVAVVSVAAIAIALLAGTGIALWQAHIANQQRDRAVVLAARGKAITEFTRMMVTEIADVDKPISIQTLLARTEEVAAKSFFENNGQQAAVLDVLGEYYLELDRSESARKSFEKALALTANSADAEFEARLRCGLGLAYSQSGNAVSAQKQIEAGLTISAEYLEVHAMCLQARSYLVWAMNDIKGALQDTRLAQDTLHRAGIDISEESAALWADSGALEAELGLTEDAERDFSKAIAQVTRLGRGEQSQAMVIENNWSIVDSDAGNPRGALAHLDRARAIARKRGIDKEKGKVFNTNYATELRHLGRYEEALREFRLGIESAELDHNVFDIAATKQGMAAVLIEIGRTTEASQLMKQVQPMIGKELPIEGSAAAQNFLLQGLLALKQQHYADAIRNFSQNMAILSARQQLSNTFAHTLKLRGDAYLADNNLDAALLDATHAYTISNSVQGRLPFSSYSGVAALLLARIEAKRNQSDAARKWSTLAYQQLQGSVGDEHPTTLEAKQLLNSMRAVN